MAARTRITKESKWAEDIVLIMQDGTGPFTRKQLAEALQAKFNIGYQEAMNEVSYAFLADKKTRKRFVQVRPGWWDLAP